MPGCSSTVGPTGSKTILATWSPRQVTVDWKDAEKRLPVAGIAGRLGMASGCVCVPETVTVPYPVSPSSRRFDSVALKWASAGS
jgi:hypothetical protein